MNLEENKALKIREVTIDSINGGTRDGFGIARGDKDLLYLIYRRRWFPIVSLRILLYDDCGKKMKWDLSNFEYSCAVLRNEERDGSCVILLSIFNPDDEDSSSIVCSDGHELYGIVTAIVAQKTSYGNEPFAFSAVLGRQKGQSAFVCDGNADLVSYMNSVSILTEELFMPPEDIFEPSEDLFEPPEELFHE